MAAQTDKKDAKRLNLKKGEPVFLVKPAIRMGGLDYLHLALLALVIILIALAFSLAYFKQGVVIKNCPYGILNDSCATPKYNNTDAVGAAQHIIAGYIYSNSSLSLVPYYTLTNRTNASYIPATNEWLVVVPYTDPLLNNKTYQISLLLYGSNLTLVHSYLEGVEPNNTNYTVAGFGTVDNGKTICTNATSIPVYLVADPYAPGALSSIMSVMNASERNQTLKASYYFIFTGFSESHYTQYSLNQTQALGRYLACASQQQNFGQFVMALKAQFNGLPISSALLYGDAAEAGLNQTALTTCISNSSQLLYNQAVLARYYDVKATPQLIVACKYETIPQTFNYTLRYVQRIQR